MSRAQDAQERPPIASRWVRIITCIEDPDVINKILAHLENKAAYNETRRLPGTEDHQGARYSTEEK